ncbi:MAG: LLM class flavin-dependent oxidoreductase [Actinobacteria bacterium]|nr:LLM class flavin-dependent oxidoreductase [Actinomycetota bacterium]
MTKVILQMDVGRISGSPSNRPGDEREQLSYRDLVGGMSDLATLADQLGFWGLAQTESDPSDAEALTLGPMLLPIVMGQATTHLRIGQFGLRMPVHDVGRLREEAAFADAALDGRLLLGSVGEPERATRRTLGRDLGLRQRTLVEADAMVRRISQEQWEVLDDAVSAPRFQPFVADDDLLRWCGSNGTTPLVMAGSPDELCRQRQLVDAAREDAGRSRSEFGVCRALQLVPDATRRSAVEAEVRCGFAQSEEAIWRSRYELAGWARAVRPEAGGEGRRRGSMADRMSEAGLLLGGTVDDVRRQIDRLLETVSCDYLVWLLNWRQISSPDTPRMLEAFAARVLPDLPTPIEA